MSSQMDIQGKYIDPEEEEEKSETSEWCEQLYMWRYTFF